MTNQEINKFVGEWCGWKVVSEPSGNTKFPIKYHLLQPNGGHARTAVSGLFGWGWNSDEESCWSDAPRYATDLNACAKFQERLDLEEWKVYTKALLDITGDSQRSPCEPFRLGHVWGVIAATPQDRSKALVAMAGGDDES